MNPSRPLLLAALAGVFSAESARGQSNLPTPVAAPQSVTVSAGQAAAMWASFTLPLSEQADPNIGGKIKVELVKDGTVVATMPLTLATKRKYPRGTAFAYLFDQGPNANVGFGGDYDPVAGQVSASVTFGEWSGTAIKASDAGSYSIRFVIAGHIYVADEGNNKIRVIQPAGATTTAKANPKTASAVDLPLHSANAADPGLKNPKGVAVDADGNIYVADTGNNVIRLITPDGTLSTFAGTIGSAGGTDGTGLAARFLSPTGLTFDSAGNLYVSDVNTDTIRKITAAGVVTTLAGANGQGGSADGTGSAARFNYPYNVRFDPNTGTLIVADSLNETIRRVTLSGVVTTIAGIAGKSGSADGPVANATFNFPCDIAFDSNGNDYITDDINNTIRELTPAGVVSTIAGAAGVSGNANGSGASARFNYPYGIVADASNNLVVTDDENNNVREITPTALVTTFAGAASSNQGFADSTDTTGTTALFSTPYGIAYGPYAVQSAAAALTISALPLAAGRLSNLSVLTSAGSAASPLSAGFVLGGAGSKALLVRAIGPTLAQFGLSGPLSDPSLTLFATGGVTMSVGSNSGWGGTTALAAAFTQTGAFALPANSLDSALLVTEPVGSYSAQITSKGGHTGQALVEVYEDDAPNPSARFINLSTLSSAGSGSNALTAGFVISGSSPETVLIRGVGPGLAAFGVGGTLSDPVLKLYSTSGGTSQVIAENFYWTDDPLAGSASSAVGAFALASSSDDCAMVMTLPPGSYSAQVTSASGTTGTALVEVYEVP